MLIRFMDFAREFEGIKFTFFFFLCWFFDFLYLPSVSSIRKGAVTAKFWFLRPLLLCFCWRVRPSLGPTVRFH